MQFALRTHLTLLFMLVALVPLLIFGGIQIGRIDDAAAAQREAQRQMAVRLADEVRSYIENHKNLVEAFAEEVSLSGRRDAASLSYSLQAIVKKFPGFLNVYVADASGRNLFFYTPQSQSETPPPGYDFSSRAYYPDVAKRRETVLSSLFRGQVTTDQPMVIIATPIFDAAGAFDGYVSAALDLSGVALLAQKYEDGRTTYATILDDRDQIVYTSAAGQSEMPQDLSQSQAVRVMREAGTGGKTLYAVLQAREEFMAFVTLPQLRWLVSVNRSSESYRAELERFWRETLLLLVAAAAGCMLLSWLIALYLNRPLRLFMEYMREIGRQNFDMPVPEKLLRKMPQELTVLAKRFFVMARKLRREQRANRQLTEELELKVAERTDNLQAVLESMTDAIVMVDMRKRIVFANRRLPELTGIALERLEAQTEDAFCCALCQRCEETSEIDAFFAGKTSDVVLCKLPETRRIALRAFTVTSAQGAVRIGHGYLLSDVTERYEVEQLKNNLISLAAHEFKTPLTGMRGGVETLLRRDVSWDEAFRRELLEGVLEDILCIQALVDDWLDISKIDAGTMRLQKTRFSLSALLEKIEQRLRRQDMAFVLQREIAPEGETLYADQGRLEQVLSNLLENAVLYSEAPARIRVSAERLPDGWRLRIVDRGTGISAAQLPQIFERFYRADLSDARSRRGTGLGLAVCKGIVEMHGGTIAVESELGKGSVFTIWLPKEDAEEELHAEETHLDRG